MNLSILLTKWMKGYLKFVMKRTIWYSIQLLLNLITGDKDFEDIDIEKPEILTPNEFVSKYVQTNVN